VVEAELRDYHRPSIYRHAAAVYALASIDRHFCRGQCVPGGIENNSKRKIEVYVDGVLRFPLAIDLHIAVLCLHSHRLPIDQYLCNLAHPGTRTFNANFAAVVESTSD